MDQAKISKIVFICQILLITLMFVGFNQLFDAVTIMWNIMIDSWDWLTTCQVHVSALFLDHCTDSGSRITSNKQDGGTCIQGCFSLVICKSGDVSVFYWLGSRAPLAGLNKGNAGVLMHQSQFSKRLCKVQQIKPHPVDFSDCKPLNNVQAK